MKNPAVIKEKPSSLSKVFSHGVIKGRRKKSTVISSNVKDINDLFSKKAFEF